MYMVKWAMCGGLGAPAMSYGAVVCACVHM